MTWEIVLVIAGTVLLGIPITIFSFKRAGLKDFSIKKGDSEFRIGKNSMPIPFLDLIMIDFNKELVRINDNINSLKLIEMVKDPMVHMDNAYDSVKELMLNFMRQIIIDIRLKKYGSIDDTWDVTKQSNYINYRDTLDFVVKKEVKKYCRNILNYVDFINLSEENINMHTLTLYKLVPYIIMQHYIGEEPNAMQISMLNIEHFLGVQIKHPLLSLDDARDISDDYYYRSKVFPMIRQGITGAIHCMKQLQGRVDKYIIEITEASNRAKLQIAEYYLKDLK